MHSVIDEQRINGPNKDIELNIRKGKAGIAEGARIGSKIVVNGSCCQFQSFIQANLLGLLKENSKRLQDLTWINNLERVRHRSVFAISRFMSPS